MSAIDPASPCIGICQMDGGIGLCAGCFRTLEEIEQWWDYGPEQKRTVLMLTEERQERILDGTAFD